MKRLLLYVHFNKLGQLSPHVRYQLEQLNPLFTKIVFLSNSPLSNTDRLSLLADGLVSEIIQRKNIGYDFVAWQEGLEHIGSEHLARFDSVTLMNDTCFGPLWEMASIYQRFEDQPETDFWGMTNHRATKKHQEHIQSYFMVFKQAVVISEIFRKFWQSVQVHENVQEVIDQMETKLTGLLLSAGFRYDVVFDTRDCETTHMLHPDFSIFNLSQTLQHRVPFIKVKGIDLNQLHAPFVIDEIGRVSAYPKRLIIDHMTQYFNPTANYLLSYKYLEDLPAVASVDKKIAVHLHTFYVDLLPDFLTVFKTFQFPYTLFITTDQESKVAEINDILEAYQMTAVIKVTGNRGRDILPMLKLKKELSTYDYIGHFHTKKSKEADFWAGESWRNELIAMLAKPANLILANLLNNDQLGIVIADIPSYFRYTKVDPWYEFSLVEDMTALWQKMRMEKAIDFEKYSNFVMSYGTYTWFKYDALHQLFDLELTDQDVPAEPLPQKSVLHAIERLLVYIAWSNGYDYRISENPIKIPPFVDTTLMNTRDNNRFNPTVPLDFTYYNGIKGAVRYFFFANKGIVSYIIKQLGGKFGKRKV